MAVTRRLEHMPAPPARTSVSHTPDHRPHTPDHRLTTTAEGFPSTLVPPSFPPLQADALAARPAAGRLPPASQTTAGVLLFGCLAFLAGALPTALPTAFLVFAATALPWRVWQYATAQGGRNAPFLADFCYCVNLATAVYLCLPASLQSPGLAGAVYALADGPVALALCAWQIPWVWHSMDHTVSVLIHILPGLAMAAHHHLPSAAAPATFGAPTQGAGAGPAPGAGALSGVRDTAAWLLAAPLAFYATWQAAYFVIVQLLARKHIVRKKMDTSYRCLARRASRARNVWARIVLRGGTPRRLLAYGLLHLAFTVSALLLFMPTYHCRWAAVLWQGAKFVAPVYYGCRYQADRVFRAAVQEAVEQRVQSQLCTQHPTAAAHPAAQPAAQPGQGAVHLKAHPAIHLQADARGCAVNGGKPLLWQP